jgi:hypothetical protein
MSSKSNLLAVALAAALMGANASATPLGALTEAASSYGANTVTRDATLGLEFLDLSLTASYSYTTLLPELTAGGAFEGFFLADTALFNALIADSGILPLTGSAAQNGFDALVGLLNPIAVEDVGGLGCDLALIAAISNAGAAPSSRAVGNVIIDRTSTGGPFSGCGPVEPGSEFITQILGPIDLDDFSTVNDHNATSPVTVGGFLLARSFSTTDIPEPADSLLVATALVTLGWSRRRVLRAQDH